MERNQIETLRKRVEQGGEINATEALALATANDMEALLHAAAALTAKGGKRRFDTCSIANVRSGACPEDCKWCAQSRHNPTGVEIYPMQEQEESMAHAREAERRSIGRFSLVASGRAVRGQALDRVCDTYRRMGRETKVGLCASLGLLDREELQKLYDAGVRRYHCNLETAPSFFKTLCTTHTIDDKMHTIRIAHEIGFEVCSGGIIGMGETMEQRVELAITLREARPVSIPVNLLIPIKGTPLEGMPRLSDDEILRTIAMFRFVHPHARIRFAGGRALMSPELQVKAMRTAVDGAIIGDLLTTLGSTVDEDRKRIAEAGYEL